MLVYFTGILLFILIIFVVNKFTNDSISLLQTLLYSITSWVGIIVVLSALAALGIVAVAVQSSLSIHVQGYYNKLNKLFTNQRTLNE